MFKVGDIIKGKDNDYGVTNEDMTKAIVRSTDGNMMNIKVLEHTHQEEIGEDFNVLNSYDNFELICVITSKYDLKDGDIITLRNGDKMIFVENGEVFYDLKCSNDNNLDYLSELNDDLTIEAGYDEENDIMKVERPIKYQEVFKRDKTIKEMTVAEISKALGYEVKIVKETE